MKATEYELINVSNGHIFEDEGWSLSDSLSNAPSMVRAGYESKCFCPDNAESGLYRYHNWLPIKRRLEGSCAPVTYKSENLAKELGLSSLYITFSGWNPTIGAEFKTCSFKETEAFSVCARLPENEKRVLVVASAGNTARAFASVCSRNNIPLLVTIPYDNMNAMWFDSPLNPCVKIIATPHFSDYFDAIALGDKICSDDAFFAEGGAKNIARRDGMGTTLLSAVECIGRIPDAYFQAVGSGTGAIAVWENNMRLIGDGRFGRHKMKLCVSQNAPFTIMYDSWMAKSRQLVDFPAEKARNACSEIKAKVLSNRKPPYSLAGGLYDALCDTDGTIYKIGNDELEYWKKLFLEKEGYDIYSAASVAVASLSEAIERKDICKDDVIMLNITGGGESGRKKELGSSIVYPQPDLVIDPERETGEILSKVKKLF